MALVTIMYVHLVSIRCLAALEYFCVIHVERNKDKTQGKTKPLKTVEPPSSYPFFLLLLFCYYRVPG